MTDTTNNSEVVIHAGDADFETLVLNSPKPVIVDFYSKTCPPCVLMGPVLEKLAAQYEHKIVVVKICVDDHKEQFKQHKFEYVPTLVFFVGGKLVQTEGGYEDYNALSEIVNDFVARYAGGKTSDSVEEAEDETFVKAIHAAEAAFEAAAVPAREKLIAALEPLEQGKDKLLAELANKLASKEITQEEHDQRVTAAEDFHESESEPAYEDYRAVVRPAREAYLAAANAAVNLYKSAAPDNAAAYSHLSSTQQDKTGI